MTTDTGARDDDDLPVIVAYEDRESALPGIEILARSLARETPALRLLMYTPLHEEVGRRLPDLDRLTVLPTTDLKGGGWNVKPRILLRALEAHPRVMWLDTDVVVTGDLVSLIRRFSPDEFVVGQEFRHAGGEGSRIRTDALGLKFGRALPWAVNSGSIIARHGHEPLLRRWLELLATDRYLAAQRLPTSERPPALVSDQEVLWGLLASDEFLDVPVGFVRTGRDMIQHCGANGYHVVDRLLSPLRRPAFVHMLGRYKPWQFHSVPDAKAARDDYLNMVCFELSAFHAACQPYRTALGRPAWLERRTWPARLLNVAGLGNVALRGLPLALAADLSGRMSRPT